MNDKGRVICGVVIWGMASLCLADTITIDGVRYEGVYVREGALRYYVQIPDAGTSISVSKSGVAPEDVVITEDRQTRAALLRTWKERAKERPRPQAQAASPQGARSVAPGLVPPGGGAGAKAFSFGPLEDVPPALAPIETFPPEIGEETSDRIEEKTKTQDENGVTKLVLKGNDKRDPERDRLITEWIQAKRLHEAQQREQSVREQEAMLADEWRAQQQDAWNEVPDAYGQSEPFAFGSNWPSVGPRYYHTWRAPAYQYGGWRPAEQDGGSESLSPNSPGGEVPAGPGAVPGDVLTHGGYYGPGWSHGGYYGAP